MPVSPFFLRNGLFSAILFIASHACSPLLHAADWSVTKLSLLYGDGYKLADESQYTITLDHAQSWAYGDIFFFVDMFNPGKGDSTEYGEFHPRFSLSKMTGKDFSNAWLKDVSIATQVEMGEKHRAYLYGIGLDLKTKDFNYFNINVYVRDNKRLSGKTWQITPYWELPFTIGNSKWSLEGFADISGTEGGSEKNAIIHPQLLLDIGHLVGHPGQLKAGIEYAYWHNKFGVKGVTESVPQIMLKWTF